MVGGGSMHIDELSYKIYKGGFETVTKLMVVAYNKAERRKILQGPPLLQSVRLAKWDSILANYS